jgi:hypothetical protein
MNAFKNTIKLVLLGTILASFGALTSCNCGADPAPAPVPYTAPVK